MIWIYPSRPCTVLERIIGWALYPIGISEMFTPKAGQRRKYEKFGQILHAGDNF